MNSKITFVFLFGHLTLSTLSGCGGSNHPKTSDNTPANTQQSEVYCADPARDNQICRPAVGECDEAARCVNGTCPANQFKSDGTKCNTSCGGVCDSGKCKVTTDCSLLECDQCHHGICGANNQCTCEGIDAGAKCDDEQACTYDDVCHEDGTCTGTTISCVSEPPPCGVKRSCNGTSECSENYPEYPDTNVPCVSDTKCATGGSCEWGTCWGTFADYRKDESEPVKDNAITPITDRYSRTIYADFLALADSEHSCHLWSYRSGFPITLSEAKKMCPSPWRLPGKGEFSTLVDTNRPPALDLAAFDTNFFCTEFWTSDCVGNCDLHFGKIYTVHVSGTVSYHNVGANGYCVLCVK